MMIDRAAAARFSLESTRLEGLSVSPETVAVLDRWVAGDIDDDELIDAIGEKKKKAKRP